MTNAGNTKFLRDRTLGTLVAVVSLFIVYFSWYVIGYVPAWQFIVMYLSLRLAQFMLEVAFFMWKGMHVDLS
jgi:hypothetical protein